MRRDVEAHDGRPLRPRHAVVLRAAGDRAFSAGLDIKTPYGQPENVWNHEDPGEALSPKWQKMWKPVVCAVQGICTAGAFYFLNESDVAPPSGVNFTRFVALAPGIAAVIAICST